MEHSTGPIVTGTSVLGIKYKGGVLLAADCLGSYSSLARFTDIRRLNKIGEKTILATSGDLADMQNILEEISIKTDTDEMLKDGCVLSPRNILHHLKQKMYQRRTEMNPLWNSHIVAGVCSETGETVLGAVTHRGVSYEADCIATGFGAYLAQPLLRKEAEGMGVDMLEEEKAVSVLEQCMRVLYYRDTRALDKIQMAKITKTSIEITEPYKISSDWTVAN